MKKYLSFLLLFCAAVLQAQEGHFTKTYSEVKSVAINIQSGELRVVKSLSGEVEVNGKYDPARLQIKATLGGGNLQISENNNRLKSNTHSSWTLAIPDGVRLAFNLGAGDVLVENTRCNLTGNTGAGSLQIRGTNGDMELNAGAGNIAVADATGKLQINSGTGDVSLLNTAGEANINTGTGHIKIERSRGQFSANTGTGDIMASSVLVHQASVFNAGTGNIQVVLGGEANADLSINAGGETASLDLNGQKANAMLTLSCHKKGGEIIAPFPFDEEEEKGDGPNSTLSKTKRMGTGQADIQVNAGKGRAIVKQ